MIDANASAVVSNNNHNNNHNYGCGLAVTYKYNFSYDKNETDEAQNWSNLIDGIVSKTKECNPTVKILSSASQVPTHAFANNHDLAKSRAENLEAKIKAAVSAKGGDASKIEFRQVAQVRGPIYEDDYQNKAKYEPFQFVKVIAK